MGNATDLRLAAATTLNGGGTVTLAQNTASRITGDDVFRLTNVDNLIQGRGQIGANSITITNQATIDANVAGQTLTLDPAAEANVLDAGPSSSTPAPCRPATAGSSSSPAIAAEPSPTPRAIIQALAGSEVQLTTGASITGGTLTAAGTGLIRVSAVRMFS